MSKFKNGGLDQCGAEPFEQQQFGAAGVEGVKSKWVQHGLVVAYAYGTRTREVACRRSPGPLQATLSNYVVCSGQLSLLHLLTWWERQGVDDWGGDMSATCITGATVGYCEQWMAA